MAAISHEGPSGHKKEQRGLNEVIVGIWYGSCYYHALVFEGPNVGST
jgi:hypothetical protein